MKLALFNTREVEFIGEFPMDQTGTTQSTNGECSRTNDCPQASDDDQKFDAFLSHSGEQKEFMRQLDEDLTNQGVSSFFDQNRDCLPLGDRFAHRIFRAIETCNVSVLLLSKKFLHSKWPMVELAASVERYEARRDPKLTILPVFFKIETDALKQITPENEKWTKFEGISNKVRAKWHRALGVVGGINGLKFKEGNNEVKFRAEIVEEIRKILPPPSPRYHVRGMQGEARMCQEVANFIVDKVEAQKKKIHIAGLCGIAGQGKTTLGKAFCNVKLDEFKSKVCHLEFSGGYPIERTKLALQYLTPRAPQSFLQTLTSQDQAQAEFYKRVKGQRVLLVLDNITDESIDEVRDYLRADLGENSLILLSARSVDLLVKYFNIDSQSYMQVPKLEKQEAIAILLERAFPREPTLTREGEDFALKCAERCSFKETCCDSTHPRTQTFHPLALQAFGGYLFSKHGLNLSKWVAEIDDVVDRGREGLDIVFALLDKAFIQMPPEHRTIFMLLTVYMLPNMSLVKVFEWIAISCNQEISSIEKAVQDLRTKAFIEEFEPQIRIHDLYIEFAQSRANKMEKWLWRKKEDDQFSIRQLIAKDKEGFKLAKLEQCMYQTISPTYIGNLLVLQLVDVKKMNKLDLGRMESLRSLTLRDCKLLAALDGTEKLTDLAWLQIIGVNPKFKLPELSSFHGLKHLEINIPASQVVDRLGDLSSCFRLREIYVVCPSLLKFPSLKGMEHLEKLEFILCDKVEGPLDCTGCVKLQTIVLNGCENLSKLILLNCDAVVASPYVDAPNAYNWAARNIEYIYELKILQLWNMRELVELPSFRPLSNLSVLELVRCSIREPPDLTCCPKLENVYFFQLKNLVSFPIFSSLTELKKLSLCNCTSVQDPPHIEGCHKLQVFHLLYNDSMKGFSFSKIDEWAELEEIQVSWHSAVEVQCQGFSPYDYCQANDDLEICLEHFRDERFRNVSDKSMPEALNKLKWLKGKKKLVKRYFRGLRLYYSLTAPFEDGDVPLKDCSKKRIILGMIDGKVTAQSRKLDKGSQDDYWLKKVEGYFGAIAPKKVEGYFGPIAPKEVEWYFGAIAPAIFTSASSDIVEYSSSLLSLSPIQGEERMCQELADFFNTLNPNEKGIHVAGLYGMPGLGKTTLAKAFRRRNLRNFDGRVCYLDFSGDSASERLKLVLENLTESMMPNEDDAENLSRALVNNEKVLLVLDNISDQNIDEVNDYLGRIDFGKDSWILLSTRRLHVLENDFKIDSRCCMHVPSLQKKEAIAIFLERILKLSAHSGLTVENGEFASKFADKCLFKGDRDLEQFHPLALKALGRHILSRWAARNKPAVGSEIQFFKLLAEHLREQWSHWAADEAADGSNDVFGLDKLFDEAADWAAHEAADGSNDVFGLLDKLFDAMKYKCRTIFLLLTTRVGPKMSTEKTYEWLQNNYNGDFENIKKAVLDLYDNAFIEEIESEIHIHDLFRELARSKHKDDFSMGRYPVATMHGGARICQELSGLFNTVPQRNGNRIVGLYGMPGQGKTTLCKTFCNLNLLNFGKVWYLDCGKDKRFRLWSRLTTEYQAYSELQFRDRDKNERELLVLDNFTGNWPDTYCERNINSWLLLSARSEDVLVCEENIDSQSCMRVPRLEEEEAIAILLGKTFPVDSKLGEQDRDFALKCAKRCLFKETCCDNTVEDPTFHPFALKIFGRHLFRKYGDDFSQWAAEADGLEIGSGGGLGDVFIVVDKALDSMDPKLRTLFVLLCLYPDNWLDVEPNRSLRFVDDDWLDVEPNRSLRRVAECFDIEYIEEAARDVMMMGFVEEIEPEIRIHDFYLEFARSKPRLLLSKIAVTSEVGAALFSKDKAGVELVNLEYCCSQKTKQVLNCLIALNVFIHGRGAMRNRRSVKNNMRFPLGMEVEGSPSLEFKDHIGILVSDSQFLNLSILNVLQYLYINIDYGGEPIDLGDLTGCVSLREIYVSCLPELLRKNCVPLFEMNGLPGLSKFPRINGLPHLEIASFERCGNVVGPLDCSNCVKLKSLVFKYCTEMANIPLIDGCTDLSKIVLNRCYPPRRYLNTAEIPELYISFSENDSTPECCGGVKNQLLWNIVTRPYEIPNLGLISNLTVLKLDDCAVPRDVTCCSMLEEVYFFRCWNCFLSFSSLKKLRILCLCNCEKLEVFHIGGCEGLEVFHLLYNGKLEYSESLFQKMDGCPLLREIRLSWRNPGDDGEGEREEDEILADWKDVMPKELEEWQWLQDKEKQVKKCCRGGKGYYCITASGVRSGTLEQAPNANPLWKWLNANPLS